MLTCLSLLLVLFYIALALLFFWDNDAWWFLQWWWWWWWWWRCVSFSMDGWGRMEQKISIWIRVGSSGYDYVAWLLAFWRSWKQNRAGHVELESSENSILVRSSLHNMCYTYKVWEEKAYQKCVEIYLLSNNIGIYHFIAEPLLQRCWRCILFLLIKWLASPSLHVFLYTRFVMLCYAILLLVTFDKLNPSNYYSGVC